MRADRQPDGSLVISENPMGLRLLLVALGAAVVAAVTLQEPRDNTRLLLGGLGALVPFAGAVGLERVRFEFDIAQRRLRWRRRNLLTRRAGELAFDEISEVPVRVRYERDLELRSAREVPAWYVALVTSAGELRLSNRMYADESGPSEIASAIAAALGKHPRAAVAESIEQLVAAGEVIQAIKLARRERGLSLAEAKQLVDRLRARSR